MITTEKLIENISQGKNLSFEESKLIFLDIMSGNLSEKKNIHIFKQSIKKRRNS